MISKFGTKVKGVLQFVFSRLVVTGLLLLLQAVWLFFLFYKLTEYAQWLTFVGIVISVIMCAALIRQDTTPPEIKISWMVLFMVMPVQGGLLYLLWGDKRPALPLRHRLERAEAVLAPLRTADPAAQQDLLDTAGVTTDFAALDLTEVPQELDTIDQTLYGAQK